MNPRKPRNDCKFCGLKVQRLKQIYCGFKCMISFLRREYVTRWLAGLEDGTRGKTSISGHIKNYLKEIRGERCEKCGWSERNPVTNNVPVEVHHVSGDNGNNRPENLQLLCPNCHSLTPTFRNLNKGKGRLSRRVGSVATAPHL